MTVWSWIFTLLILFLIVRTVIAVRRVRSSLSLEGADAALQLAVLKENLLENAQESNLEKLLAFCKEQGLEADADVYRPLLQRQKSLRRTALPLVEDDQLYEEQARWLDAIEPMEFQYAYQAHAEGDFEQYAQFCLEGVLRLYSDAKIQEHLGVLENTAHLHEDFPVAATRIRALTEQFQVLCQKRDQSVAEPDALERLRQDKRAWVEAVRALIA